MAEKKSPRGRPATPADKRLGERLELRVRPEEKQAYKAAAEADGVSVSDWVRRLLNPAAGIRP